MGLEELEGAFVAETGAGAGYEDGFGGEVESGWEGRDGRVYLLGPDAAEIHFGGLLKVGIGMGRVLEWSEWSFGSQ